MSLKKSLGVMYIFAVLIFILYTLTTFTPLKKGDVVRFGCYEQDAIFDNGIEPIEWIVLSVNGTEATLISRYGLEAVKFDESKALTNIWSECSLRDWLNNVFFEKAFDDYEKNIIKTPMLHNPVNPFVDEQELYETEDKVYIPSYVDVLGRAWDEEYYYNVYSDELSQKWKCLLTKYAKEVLKSKFREEYNIMYSSSSDRKQEEDNSDKGVYTYPWLLRTPGAYDGYVMGVSSTGQLEFGGYDICYSNIIRPMICVDLSSDYFNVRNEELKNQEHIPVSEKDLYEPEPTRIPVYTPLNSDYTMLSSLKQGDYLGFGSYEQDGNLENGSEIIEWLVLKNNNGTILLLSKDILDYRAYNDINQDILWPDSSIRNWLNNDFYDLAFDTYEKSVIIEHASVGDREPEYENDRYESKDKVFLLSYDDIINPTYGFDSKDYEADIYRKSSYTDAVLLNHPDLIEEGNGNDEGIKECWWLRNRSRRTVVIDEETRWFQGTCACNGHYSSGMNLEIESGIRPAIIIGESGK